MKYQCDPGYQMKKGSPVVYCRLDEEGNPEWSEGSDVECVGEWIGMWDGVCVRGWGKGVCVGGFITRHS